MTGTVQSQDTSQQTSVWLRGLLTVAWADGHLDPEEQDLITSLTHQPLTECDTVPPLQPVSPTELAGVLGHDTHLAENFLRMAVMVALADRSYSESEDELLRQYCEALDLKPEALDALRTTFSQICTQAQLPEGNQTASPLMPPHPGDGATPDLLQPLRGWLDQMEIHDPKVAHALCRLIPPQCPFERDITLFGRKVVHIPAMCKLNPLYEQLVGLRFRALCYLADECGEDVAPYC